MGKQTFDWSHMLGDYFVFMTVGIFGYTKKVQSRNNYGLQSINAVATM